LAAPLLARAPSRPRELLPLAVAAGALIQTLGIGAGGWVAPALGFIVLVWLARERLAGLPRSALSLASCGGLTAAFVVPVWVVLGAFLSKDAGLFSTGQSTATRMGNLIQPLSGWQLAGVWPAGDFRVGQNSYLSLTAPTLVSALLIVLVLLAAICTLAVCARRGQYGPALFVVAALGGCAILYVAGTTPWVIGKALAISSPALLAAALIGTGMLWSGHRLRTVGGTGRLTRVWSRHGWLVGMLATVAIGAGVLWSNALAYHDATLAPRDRLAELQRIGELVASKGPTLLNEYEVYADRHFLREGAPVEPAEYRSVLLALRDGVLLTKNGTADLDSFPLATIEPYRSIVTRRSPAESRPPSIYRLVWQGRYYQLWQRPEHPSTSILEHVPLGESNTLPYCGAAQDAPSRPLCSVDPVAVPSCAQVRSLGRQAAREHAQLVAYQRPAPIVARGEETLWPASWLHNTESHTLTPTTPGQAVTHIAVASSQSYELWLLGLFARGFVVSVDGRQVGRVKNELGGEDWVQVADVPLTSGVHTFTITYPHSDLTPGSGDNSFTSLSAIALAAHSPPSELINVSPQQASQLCNRPLDWIEIVTGAG
ncbi:MAG TPA: hypothetical protein VMU66_00675, partial [Gaiellales bacterium]|nr:hypothetical protein [Gaiellales bacterium]